MNERYKNIKVAFYLAYKDMVFNKKSLVLISSIIGLSYLSGIFIGAVINGMQVHIENEMITTLTGNIIILPKEDDQYIYGVNEILDKLKHVPGVVGASARYIVPIKLIDKNNHETGINLIIVDPDKERYTTHIPEYIIEGKYLSKDTKKGIIIGSVITKKYGVYKTINRIDVSAGDIITLESPFGTRRIKVLGIYKTGLAGAELYAYMNVKQAERLLGVDLENQDMATQIIIKTEKKGDEYKIVNLLHNIGINAKIRTWEEQLGSIKQFTDSFMILNRIALFVSIIVSFGIVYIMMYINAFQKKSQLGILKAIGMKSNTIILSYTFQGLFYGIIGVTLGGLLTKLIVFYFQNNPIKMPFGDIVPILQTNIVFNSAFLIVLFGTMGGYLSSKSIAHQRILEMIFKG